MLGLGTNADKIWLPKSVVCLRYYDSFRFRSDMTAALTVAVEIFPTSIAMAIMCGLPFRNGVYGAAIAGLLTSILGRTKIQICAPSLTVLALAASIVSRGGVRDLSLTALLAGAFLLLLAATGLGAAVKFIPRSVVVGFSTGLAILIITGILPHLLGMTIAIQANDVRTGATAGIPSFSGISTPAIIMALATLILIAACRKISAFIPVSLIAMTIGALSVKFWHIPVQMIGADYGSAWPSLPSPLDQSLNFDLPGGFIAQAMAIAVLIAIESLETGKLTASLTGEHRRPRVDLFIDGAANMACSLVGGLPASGSCLYTATNARSGAQTPVAGLLQAMFQLALLLLAAPFVELVPFSVMAAILVWNVVSMPHWGKVLDLLKLPMQASVWIVTSVLTIATDFPMALACGMFIAMSLHIRKRHVLGRA
jgi:SulP family sulfate permease